MRPHTVHATLALACGLLAACAPIRFKPAEYVIADERIPGFPSACPVRLVNGQPEAVRQLVYTPGRGMDASYQEVTAALVAQLGKELEKRGCRVSDDAPKTITVSIEHLEGVMHFATLEGRLHLRYQLGDDEPHEIQINNHSPANLFRAMNGVVAKTVIALLTDAEVLDYLNRPAAAAKAAAGEAPGTQP